MGKIAKAFELWKRVSDVTLPIVDEAVEFKKTPTILSGARMALRLHNHISKLFTSEKEISYPTGYDADPDWEIISNDTKIHEIIYAQLITKPHKLEDTFKDIAEYQTLTVNGHQIGIVVSGSSKLLYLKKEGTEEIYTFLRSLFWDYLGNQVVYAINEEQGIWEFASAEALHGTETSITKQYIQEINAYRAKGYQRSLLLYGPPGTGKSNTAACILRSCSPRTLILPSITSMRTQWFQSNCKLLKPDAVLLEDIDHFNDGNLHNLLGIIELLNKKGVLLVATCNKICQLDDALIRAGRFDEVVEIKNLPEEVLNILMNGDMEIIDKVKTFPIAAILEVKRRMEVLGREEALNRIKDLELRVKRSNKSEVYSLDDYDDDADDYENEEENSPDDLEC